MKEKGNNLAMRVLHVIYSIDPIQGGTVEALLQIVNASKKSNQQHEILTLDDPALLVKFGHNQTIHAVGPTKRFYGDTPELDNWLNQHLSDYSCAIIHGCWQYHGLATYRSCREKRIPYFQYTHGMLDPWFKKTYPLKHFKKWLYWPWAEFQILKHATKVLFTCEEEQRLAAQSFWLYKVDPTIIGLGIKKPEVDLNHCKEVFLNTHPSLKGKRLLTFMSRIHAKKGIDLLIEAAIDYQKSYPSRSNPNSQRFSIVIAGPCNDEDYLKELKKLSSSMQTNGPIQEIKWIGMVRDEMKWGLLAVSEAFILPSHQENFGMVVPESLSCGTPVLISDKVNIWREIRNTNAGIVKTDTHEGVRSLLEDWEQLSPEERKSFRECATQSFEDRFTIDSNATKLFALIDEHCNPYHSQ